MPREKALLISANVHFRDAWNKLKKYMYGTGWEEEFITDVQKILVVWLRMAQGGQFDLLKSTFYTKHSEITKLIELASFDLESPIMPFSERDRGYILDLLNEFNKIEKFLEIYSYI
jgi:hypothetical protein